MLLGKSKFDTCWREAVALKHNRPKAVVPDVSNLSHAEAIDVLIGSLAQELKDIILGHFLLTLLSRKCTVVHSVSSPGCHLSYIEKDDPNTKDAVTLVHSDPLHPHLNYKPPIGLRLDRATRAIFAREYYTNNTFFIKARKYNLDDVRKLLESLPKAHRDLIKEIKWDGLFRKDMVMKSSLGGIWATSHALMYGPHGTNLGLRERSFADLLPGDRRFSLLVLVRVREDEVTSEWHLSSGKSTPLAC